MTQHMPELFILLIVTVFLIQEAKEKRIIFHCTKCGKEVESKDIREGCVCKDCYKEDKYDYCRGSTKNHNGSKE